MTGGAHVREMWAADVAAVMAMAEELPSAPHWPAATYQAALSGGAGPDRLALVVEDAGGEPVGFAIALLLPPEAELETIVVARGHQRRGLARRLVQALIEGLRGRGVGQLDLEVRASNGAALGLYRGLGFAEVGRRRNYYVDPVEDALLLRLIF